jgi:hypothetical protein
MIVAPGIIVRTHFILALAGLVLGFTVACTDTDDVARTVEQTSGGASSTNTSANGGGGGKGGTSGETSGGTSGGTGGATSQCWELKPWTSDGCGACEMTMDQYCAEYSCSVDPLPSCDGLPAAYSLDEGCGLLKVRMSGHGGSIYTESVYDATTRILKYYYDNGGRSSGCMPKLTVGVKPTCDSWTTLCEGVGGS